MSLEFSITPSRQKRNGKLRFADDPKSGEPVAAMIKPSKLRTVRRAAGVLLVVCAAALMVNSSFNMRRGPTLFWAAFDAKSRTAIVELTNATTRSWLFQLNVVQGLPKPSYSIAPEKKGMPCWGGEFEEGIHCSGYLYRRDSSGRFLAPEVPGPSPHLAGTLTNVVLHPQQALTFSVPIGDIRGLSKVGVTYHRPAASSRLGRTAADMLAMLARARRILHLQPATPFQGWCETALPGAATAH